MQCVRHKSWRPVLCYNIYSMHHEQWFIIDTDRERIYRRFSLNVIGLFSPPKYEKTCIPRPIQRGVYYLHYFINEIFTPLGKKCIWYNNNNSNTTGKKKNNDVPKFAPPPPPPLPPLLLHWYTALWIVFTDLP